MPHVDSNIFVAPERFLRLLAGTEPGSMPANRCRGLPTACTVLFRERVDSVPTGRWAAFRLHVFESPLGDAAVLAHPPEAVNLHVNACRRRMAANEPTA